MGDKWLLKRLWEPKIILLLHVQYSTSALSRVLIGGAAASPARAGRLFHFTRSDEYDTILLIFRDRHLFCSCGLCLRQVSHCGSGWLRTPWVAQDRLEFAAFLP